MSDLVTHRCSCVVDKEGTRCGRVPAYWHAGTNSGGPYWCCAECEVRCEDMVRRIFKQRKIE